MGQGFTFDASWDGVRMDVLSANVRQGRKGKHHTFPKRDGGTKEDTGREPWICDMEFIFVDRKAQPGELTKPGTALERFNEFDGLVADGNPKRLVHPYVGAKLVTISNFVHNADGDGGIEISASATFTEEDSLPPTFAAGVGVQTIAGAHEVEAKAAQAGNALEIEGANLSTDELAASQAELDSAVSAVETWDSDPTITAREVHLQMSSINNALNARLDLLDVADNLDRYQIFKQYTLLQYQVRLAAEGFTTDTTRIVTITVKQPLPLRVIAARFYGANQADRRFAEMIELNPEIQNPALIGSGIELKAYAANAEPGAF